MSSMIGIKPFLAGLRLWLCGMLALFPTLAASEKAIRVDDLLAKQSALGKISASSASLAIEHAVKQLKAGDALILPSQTEFDVVRINDLPRDVQIIGGQGQEIRFSGLAKGTVFYGGQYTIVAPKEAAAFEDAFFINTSTKPGSGDSASYSGDVSLKGGNFSNTYWISNIGKFVIDGSMTNCTGLYMRYNHEGKKEPTGSFDFKLHGSGQNVKILMMVEHNQGNDKPAVIVEGGDGIQFAGGATEGSSGHPTVPHQYFLKNCKNVYLGHRRFFSNRQKNNSTWYASPPITLAVEGGEGNVLDNIVDIGNPSVLSLSSTDPKLQIWSLSLENPSDLGSTQNHFVYSFNDNNMPGVDTWTDPRDISNERILYYKNGADSIDLTAPGAKLPAGVFLPPPPSVPKCDIPKAPTLKYKLAAGFGQAAIEAGADPTGRTFSDEAFAKVLKEKNILELPAGTFRLQRPLSLGEHAIPGTGAYQGNKLWIAGSGKGITRILYNGRGAAIKGGSSSLAKTVTTGAPRNVETVLQDMTVEGGEYGFQISGHNVVQIDVDYKDYSIAGIAFLGGSEPEQGRFISCSFTGGEYGFYYNGYMDKYLIYRCQFSNHSKGGIYCINVVNLQTGVYQCNFKNINGPGVAFIGGSNVYGQGGYCYRVDNNTFEECGSETQPVIHMGHGWLGVCSNNTITTKTKQIYAAFYGNFSALENMTVDANFIDGTAFYLGHQRFERTAGIGGSRVANIQTNGSIKFLKHDFMKDFPMHEDPTKRKNQPYLEGMYADMPWAFTHMFYNVKSENINAGYALFKNGAAALDLCQFTEGGTCQAAQVSIRQPASLLLKQLGSESVYDLHGKQIIKNGNTGPLPKGLYLKKGSGKGVNKQIHL